jgi:hypothetical protein
VLKKLEKMLKYAVKSISIQDIDNQTFQKKAVLNPDYDRFIYQSGNCKKYLLYYAHSQGVIENHHLKEHLEK